MCAPYARCWIGRARRRDASKPGDRRRMASGLSGEEQALIDAYWRAANYLSVGQIYLYDNPLLKEPLAEKQCKPRLLGHWGTTPGLNSSTCTCTGDQEARPGHDLHHRPRPRRAGRSSPTPTSKAPTARSIPNISQDEDGMKRLFKQFSFPGGIPSHVAPETPGSIHEGGELGYALVARLRRGLRQPGPDRRLRRRRRRGRDRAARDELALEQVPQPGHRRRGAADPAPQRLQDRQPDACSRASATRSSSSSSAATATRRYFVEGDDPATMHQLMAATLDTVVDEIRRIQADARDERLHASARAGR